MARRTEDESVQLCRIGRGEDRKAERGEDANRMMIRAQPCFLSRKDPSRCDKWKARKGVYRLVSAQRGPSW